MSTDLKPSKDIQRILISSTCRFVGDYQSGNFSISHAWPGDNGNVISRFREGPASRSAYVLSMLTKTKRDARSIQINFDWVGGVICSYLSLLFGKRFDTHGTIQGGGHFGLPNLSQYTQLCDSDLLQNNHLPRADISIPLNFTNVSCLEPILKENTSPEAIAFEAAVKFYSQALQNVEKNIEVAYLNLITAGEILANQHSPQKEELLDGTIQSILRDVREYVPDGNKCANILASQMRQIKKRFANAIEDLVDDQFFDGSEHEEKFRKMSKESLGSRVRAAYDIRSQYVHSGVSFGRWIAPRGTPPYNEVQLGKPVLEDKRISKLLVKAPTYVGLERIIRYCLIKFAVKHSLIVLPK